MTTIIVMLWLVMCAVGLAVGCSTLLSPGFKFKRDLVQGIGAISVLMTAIPLATNAVVDDSRVITHKVFLDIKIANYTEESTGKNREATGSGRIVIGLYGKDAPKSVDLFLATINGQYNGIEGPNFVNSQFSRFLDGLLQLENIRGINTINIAGSQQYEFRGNILTNYQPILETNGIKHSRKGLLTRRQLTAIPEFGITTMELPLLDAFNVVFGEVIEGYDTVVEEICKIQVYEWKTRTGYSGAVKNDESLDGALADSWFSTQKQVFLKAGEMFGDKRAIDRRGKLLRRVTVKNAGLL